MSTATKPGQIWASKTHPTDRLRVDLVRPAHVEFTYVGGIMHILRTEEFLDAFELVEDTPAPLDPSKVQAGDTVTLTRGKASVTDEVRQVHEHTPATTVFGIGLSEVRTQGYFWVAGSPEHWTLTAHQPAPKPEVALPIKTSSVVEDVDNAMRYFRANGGVPWVSESGTWQTDEYVARLNWRPLVVIDPAAVDVDALTTTFHNASHYGVDLPLEGAAYLARVARSFFVGGESR